MKTIKILGTGCANCIALENNVKLALEKASMKADVIKITDIEEIMNYNVMGTPGLVIDEKVISAGKVLSVDEITQLLSNDSCCGGDTQKSSEKGCCSDTDNCDTGCAPKKEPKTPKKPCCGGMC